MADDRRVVEQDIKRILIDRDITTIKQAFYRILCFEIRNNNTRVEDHNCYSRGSIYGFNVKSLIRTFISFCSKVLACHL
jgi:hypothetical protein